MCVRVFFFYYFFVIWFQFSVFGFRFNGKCQFNGTIFGVSRLPRVINKSVSRFAFPFLFHALHFTSYSFHFTPLLYFPKTSHRFFASHHFSMANSQQLMIADMVAQAVQRQLSNSRIPLPPPPPYSPYLASPQLNVDNQFPPSALITPPLSSGQASLSRSDSASSSASLSKRDSSASHSSSGGSSQNPDERDVFSSDDDDVASNISRKKKRKRVPISYLEDSSERATARTPLI